MEIFRKGISIYRTILLLSELHFRLQALTLPLIFLLIYTHEVIFELQTISSVTSHVVLLLLRFIFALILDGGPLSYLFMVIPFVLFFMNCSRSTPWDPPLFLSFLPSLLSCSVCSPTRGRHHWLSSHQVQMVMSFMSTLAAEQVRMHSEPMRNSQTCEKICQSCCVVCFDRQPRDCSWTFETFFPSWGYLQRECNQLEFTCHRNNSS